MIRHAHHGAAVRLGLAAVVAAGLAAVLFAARPAPAVWASEPPATEVAGPAAPQAGDPLELAWSSLESDRTYAVAWGDYDGDGDLDLAAGNQYHKTRLYRNDGGVLTSAGVWQPEDGPNDIYSLAWGDVDRDGDLDLAAAVWCAPNRVYLNDTGVLRPSASWSSEESDCTMSVAWGDYDGDGYPDLAVGNASQRARVYHNNGGTLSTSATWSYEDELGALTASSIAWADYDGDGDLDLGVAGSGRASRVYRNDNGTLTTVAAWMPSYYGGTNTTSIAWGDYDSDGDADLLAGNDGYPLHIYENYGNTLERGAGLVFLAR